MRVNSLTYLIIFHFFLNILLLSCNSQSNKNQFNLLINEYCQSFKNLNIPSLKMNIDKNFNEIQPIDSLQIQEDFFISVKKRLKTFNQNALNDNQKIDYDLLDYTLTLNLERIKLEKDWKLHSKNSLKINSLLQLSNGKEWYKYYLKKWTSDNVTPKEILEFGMKEIEKVKKKIKEIQLESNKDSIEFYQYLNSSKFHTLNYKNLEKEFNKISSTISKTYTKLFPGSEAIHKLKIKRNPHLRLKNVPAYYSENTFYFTVFEQAFNLRLKDIFFLHEAIPGHHYQTIMNEKVKTSKLRQLDYYRGYREGWATYVEELGKELGLYNNIYDYLGKWEWDIVRSVRVVLDLGIHYYGWTDEKALKFWKEHIANQDSIALREINRIKSMPCQVITYKYVANEILKLKKKEKNNYGLTDLEFHKKILDMGSLPIFVLKKQFCK